MLDRRQFITTATATTLLGANPVLAHKRDPNYVLPPEFMPTVVDMKVALNPGEIHVDPNTFNLYWTLEGAQAIRYSIGIGRKGLYHAGSFMIRRKAKWPTWTPTPAMIKRNPRAYKRFSGGMRGGVNNPLGARALYLYSGKRDTYLRIHGTNAPQTIGTAVSNGCARLVNDHIVDLYNRVPNNTKAVLHPKGNSIIFS